MPSTGAGLRRRLLKGKILLINIVFTGVALFAARPVKAALGISIEV